MRESDRHRFLLLWQTKQFIRNIIGRSLSLFKWSLVVADRCQWMCPHAACTHYLCSILEQGRVRACTVECCSGGILKMTTSSLTANRKRELVPLHPSSSLSRPRFSDWQPFWMYYESLPAASLLSGHLLGPQCQALCARAQPPSNPIFCPSCRPSSPNKPLIVT